MEAAMSQAPVVACFGRRGTGKTTLARTIAHHQARVLVWDYCAEYGPLAYRSGGNLDALEEYLKSARGEQFWAARYLPLSPKAQEKDESRQGTPVRCGGRKGCGKDGQKAPLEIKNRFPLSLSRNSNKRSPVTNQMARHGKLRLHSQMA